MSDAECDAESDPVTDPASDTQREPASDTEREPASDTEREPASDAQCATLGDPAHPIPDSYWVDPGRFLAGPLPAAEERAVLRARITALLDLGIRTVIDLRTPAEPPSIRALLDKMSTSEVDPVWFGAPILNGGAPTVAQMQSILDLVDASLARGRGAYVHCQGGLGRTGTVVACWWIRHGRHDAESALRELMRCRVGQPHGDRPSPETAPQYRLVRSWLPGQ